MLQYYWGRRVILILEDETGGAPWEAGHEITLPHSAELVLFSAKFPDPAEILPGPGMVVSLKTSTGVGRLWCVSFKEKRRKQWGMEHTAGVFASIWMLWSLYSDQKKKGSWLSGLFTHFCDCLLVCWEMTYSPCETQTSLYHAACITLMEFCQLRIKCGLKKQL